MTTWSRSDNSSCRSKTIKLVQSFRPCSQKGLQNGSWLPGLLRTRGSSCHQIHACRHFLKSNGDDQQLLQAKPIADLFPYTTVLFAGTCRTQTFVAGRSSPVDSHQSLEHLSLRLQDLLPGAPVVIRHTSFSCLRQSTEHSMILLHSTKYSRLRPLVTVT